MKAMISLHRYNCWFEYVNSDALNRPALLKIKKKNKKEETSMQTD